MLGLQNEASKRAGCFHFRLFCACFFLTSPQKNRLTLAFEEYNQTNKAFNQRKTILAEKQPGWFSEVIIDRISEEDTNCMADINYVTHELNRLLALAC